MSRPSTKIRTADGGAIRWSRVHHFAYAEDGSGIIAYVEGQAVPLAGNPVDVEAELVRLAVERDRDAAERFGGPAEPWTGGTGQEGIERALAELAKRQ